MAWLELQRCCIVITRAHGTESTTEPAATSRTALDIYIYIYIYDIILCVCVCVCVCVCTYIDSEYIYTHNLYRYIYICTQVFIPDAAAGCEMVDVDIAEGGASSLCPV